MKQLAFLLLLLLVGPSQAAMHGGPLPATGCAARPGFADGCAGANANGSVQFTNFFTSRALQSSQTYVTRPPWNVAGVDYPVGVPTNISLKDPSTGTLPTGCTYHTTPQLEVACNSTAADIDFNGWDFSLHNGIFLTINSNVTSTNFTIENCNFAYGSNLMQDFYMVQFPPSGGPTNIIVKNTTFDGKGLTWTNAVTSGAGPSVALNTGNAAVGSINVTYSAFLGVTSRNASYPGGNGNSFVWKYNYSEGISYYNAQITATIDNGSGTGSPAGTVLTVTAVAAGTVISTNTPGVAGAGINSATTISSAGTGTGGTGTYNVNISQAVASETMFTYGTHGSGHQVTGANNATLGLYQVSYSTFMEPANAGGGSSWIEPFVSSSTGVTMTSWVLDHSTIVANISNAPTGPSMGFLVGNNHTLTFTAAALTSNYFDPTGSFGCIDFVGTGTPTITGNVDLLDASAVTSPSGACFGHQ
jgi:hypothetical protein